MKRVPLVTKKEAISKVQAAIASAASSSNARPITVLDEDPRELWWAWIVPVQSVEYAVSRDPRDLLIGLGPYLVDKFTGEVLPTGSGTRLHPIERARRYRAWWDFRGPNWIMKL